MLFLRSWLEDYIDLSGFSNQELANLITLKSNEVDDILEIDDYFQNKVVVGKIRNVRKHANADRLKVFEVDIGQNLQNIQIVSAADNVRENLLVPVALVGCNLAYFKVTERNLRGITSYGLCLGKSELMLETKMSPGLWELEKDLQEEYSLEENFDRFLGHSICQVLPKFFAKESLFDIKVLPDRIAQLGNHLGMAWEIAVIAENLNLLKEPFKEILLQEGFLKKQLKITKDQYNQSFKDSQGEEYTIEFIDNTNYTNSFNLYQLELDREFILPCEMQKRMFLTQKNLIGGLADLSNYLLYDIGQPNHFFSQDRILEF